MPVYNYECAECSIMTERYLKLESYQTSQHCDKCGNVMTKILTPTRFNIDYSEYECPVTGRIIRGRKQHEENLKRTGCRLLEDGEMDAVRKDNYYADKRLEDNIEKSVEKAINGMSTKDVERLAKEVESGIDCGIIRQ